MTKSGRWALWSRGSKPRPIDMWVEETENFTFEEALTVFLRWKSEGQHVRLEWIPDNAYGPLPDGTYQ